MGTLTVTRTIPRPVDQFWPVLADFGGIANFHPYVQRSPLHGEQNGGVGTARTCHFHDGNFVEEVVRDWDDGKSTVVEIVQGSMPLKRAVATLTVTPAVGGTEVAFAMDYTPKMGVLGAVMDTLVMQGKFRTMLTRVLAGLEAHLESGDVIGPDSQLAA